MEAAFLIFLFAFISIWTMLCIYILRGLLFETPFYPSSISKLEKAFNDLRINYGPETKFVDIGSGDGRTVIWAGRKGMKAFGIEINPFLTLFSKIKIALFGIRENAEILQHDFFKHDYSQYDIVYLYIYREVMNKLKDKLFSELKDGSIIVSNVFEFDDLKPDQVSGRFKLYKIKKS